MLKPQRIASLLSSATEMLYGMGLGARVVAVSHECDFPRSVADKPRATRSHVDAARNSQAIDRQVKQLAASGAPLYELDRELLGRLAPDLIVTQAQCDVCAVKYQDVVDLVRNEPRLGHTQVLALNPQSLDDTFEDILRIGRAAGCVEAAARLASSLRRRVNAVREQVEPLAAGERPRVVCIEWIEPLMLAANWTPQLIELAGGQNGLTTAGWHSGYHPWSDVVNYDPQLLVVSPCGFDLPRTWQEIDALFDLPGWHKLTAVRTDRVFAVDGNAYLNRSGPRLVDSLEILAHLAHPARFDWPTWLAPRDQVLRALPAAGTVVSG